jgi:hypothetical protein
VIERVSLDGHRFVSRIFGIDRHRLIFGDETLSEILNLLKQLDKLRDCRGLILFKAVPLLDEANAVRGEGSLEIEPRHRDSVFVPGEAHGVKEFADGREGLPKQLCVECAQCRHDEVNGFEIVLVENLEQRAGHRRRGDADTPDAFDRQSILRDPKPDQIVWLYA